YLPVIDFPDHRDSRDQVFASHEHRGWLVIGVGHYRPNLDFDLFGSLHADSHIVIPAKVVLDGGVEGITSDLQRLEGCNTRQGYDYDFGNASRSEERRVGKGRRRSE